MADTKISALPAATDLTDAVIPIVQGGANKKAAAGLITPAAIGAATAAQGAKADSALQPNASATDIANTPAGGIVATNVQAAINEIDTKLGTVDDALDAINGEIV